MGQGEDRDGKRWESGRGREEIIIII